MQLSENLLNELGFFVIQKWLAERIHCSRTLENLDKISPESFRPEALNLLNLTEDIVRSFERKEAIPMGDFPDVSEWISKLNIEGHIIKPDEFKDLIKILELGRLLHNIVKEDGFPNWQQYKEIFLDLPEGEKRIHSVFDDDYKVKSSASTELSSIRKKIRYTEAAIQKRMESLFQESLKNKWLQDDRIVWRDGRLVLPMSASHKRKISGIVQGRSATGQTIFIEPMEIVERSNELMELKSDEIAEINRILRELSGFFRQYSDAIRDSFAILVKFDLHYTFGRLADTLRCVRPEFHEKGSMDIQNGRYPILELTGKDVIPLSLSLEQNARILLLSGPNAGGKTVVLKTIGLFSIMAQSGMFLPADVAEIPFFKNIIADIGDQQSVEDDLSTFSAHIQNLKTVVDYADQNTLVLLDELGTGTDPDAGAAISQALLEHLQKKKSCLIATTHLGQLKLWAHESEGIINGGMRFDPDELAPTYELNVGQPGASYAIEISNRMGMSPHIIDRAQTLLGRSSVALEDLLNKLEVERLSASRLSKEMKTRSQKLTFKEKEVERLEIEIKRIRKKANQEARKEAEQLILETRRSMENIVSKIRNTQADKDIIRKSRSHLQNQLNRFKKQEKKQDEPIVDPLSWSEASKDLKVYVPHLDANGVIISPPGKNGKTTILINNIRMTLHISKLQAAAISKHIPKSDKIKTGVYDVSRPESMQLDLRGKRVNEALTELASFLDGALIASLPTAHILHGKGTGALQEAVKEYLKDQSFIKSFEFARPDQGGAGITIVQFK
ncbi:MAG: hypothetical protein HN729_05150 [Candidatus Marinimicrobia bacterium]|jgi:DNA mismatch repair protein MutS2|nr:hypothetical protein [Candidatus Neomarinimicrobiota bacterium]MBT3634611.1 hypothetical protein [Candidatus Neomarinimicrobiota bacterium]MBT3683308.1 hypothetical protein [Candidatus Neomarinimicrobiota bacterium]MBT3760265.1 hypothetical protein [Candidatus Neomarinimicrobiota bacterium]MBT3896360.1 hypothetical protein [Candidatus Neomarinimicrobiota bacterium]